MSPEQQRMEILRLWAEGLTSGRIAKALGTTRNVVIGFVSRARLRGVNVDPQHLHREAVRHLRKTQTRPDPKKTGERIVPLTLAEVATPEQIFGRPNALMQGIKKAPPPPVNAKGEPPKPVKGRWVHLLKTRPNSCRFADGHDNQGRHRFCNADAIPNKSWCQEHYDRVYQPRGYKNV